MDNYRRMIDVPMTREMIEAVKTNVFKIKSNKNDMSTKSKNTLRKFDYILDKEVESHQGANAWSLFNAFTEILKESPTTLQQRTSRLHNVFDSFCKTKAPERLDSLLSLPQAELALS